MEIKGKRATRSIGAAAIASPTASPTAAPGETVGDSPAVPATGALATGSSALQGAPAPAPAPAPALPMTLPVRGPDPLPAPIGGETLAVLAGYRAAITHALDALGEEAAALTRGGIEVTARTAIDMLAVRTWSDAMAVNAGFARASFDNWMGGSTRFSALGAKLVIESWHPFMAQLGKSWSRNPG